VSAQTGSTRPLPATHHPSALLSRDAMRWRFYAVAALGCILLVAYLARGVDPQNEYVQLAGGLAFSPYWPPLSTASGVCREGS
jgi:hypothetical protein